MAILILMSDGLPTPCWEVYLPKAEAIFYEGDEKHRDSLRQYATKGNMRFYAQMPSKDVMVFAFWNGKADKVDKLLCEYPLRCRRIFLPTEDGCGFEEL